jgi:ubiquitin carboxyl-terminal hydrolase 14
MHDLNDFQAVLTHKGRSSNSGHYVGWIRLGGDRWCMCDDDQVRMISSDDVLKLSGGGDWHCAYVLLYGPKKLVTEMPSTTPAEAVDATKHN